MLTLQTNSWNLLLRTFAIIFLAIIFKPLVDGFQNEPNSQNIIFWKFKLIHLLYIVVIALVFYAVTVITSIFGIIKVEVDKDASKIFFTSVIGKKEILIDEIDNYFTTTHENGLKKWDGLLLTLKSQKAIQLAGQNLKSIEEFGDYLNEVNVKCLGKRKMKFPFN